MYDGYQYDLKITMILTDGLTLKQTISIADSLQYCLENMPKVSKAVVQFQLENDLHTKKENGKCNTYL